MLSGDESLGRSDGAVDIRDWSAFVEHPGFDFDRDPRVHLGLLPVPFIGSPETADVFILLLNLGFSPSDYFAESVSEPLRVALRTILRQQRAASEFPFWCLDPEICFSGGFQYWRAKLRDPIRALTDARGLALRDALSVLARRICVVQLFPYHSSIAPPVGIMRGLRSSRLAMAFARDVLEPRARAGEALLVVARSAAEWGLEEGPGVVVYRGAEARSAHLSQRSRGGGAIMARVARAP